MSDLLPCPFCGATPHRGKTGIQYDQLHGEPFQRYRVWCPHGCASIDRINEEQTRAAWNTRHAGTPVAWLLNHPHHGERLSQAAITDGDRSLGWVDTPLYALVSLTSPPKAEAGEAVACRYFDEGVWMYDEEMHTGWEPLYTTPEPRGDGVRVTDERVEAEARAEVIRQLCGTDLNGGFIRDLCFTVWSICHNPTHEDGNADWGSDTLPTVQAGVAKVRAALEAALPPHGEGRAEIVEECSKVAADWLNNWAGDLYATFESYVEAQTTGKHNGRRINPGDAKMYAGQFRERAEAVAGCADEVAVAIRSISKPRRP